MEKVYCIKNFCIVENYITNLKFSFIKGSYYNMYYSDNVSCWISLENGMLQMFYYDDRLIPSFKLYFHTLKELRVLKISKIENNYL